MTTFQIIMLVAAAFFAFKMYEYVQQMEEPSQKDGDTDASEHTDVTTLVEEADHAYEAGDVERAGALLAEANTLTPDTPEILNKLAFICSKEDKLDEAIKYYEHSLGVDTQDDLVHNALASLYRTQSDFEKARHHYEAALAIDGSYEVTYFNYGNLLVDLEEQDEAKAMYAKALEIKPDFMQAKFELEKLS